MTTFEWKWDSEQFINIKEGADIIKFASKDQAVEISGTALTAIPNGEQSKSLVIGSIDFKVNMPLSVLEEIVTKLRSES